MGILIRLCVLARQVLLPAFDGIRPVLDNGGHDLEEVEKLAEKGSLQ
jgi:hypothetical protein